MRLWSIHPRYLDAKGLVALWREALLAQKVLAGQTKGYKHHPQLNRFRLQQNPQKSIGIYLSRIAVEAEMRGYNFNKSKINRPDFSGGPPEMTVNSGQIEYERKHLIKKLEKRDPEWLEKVKHEQLWQPHPLFNVKDGPVEDWEKY